jgi:hypothetical protein
MKHYSPIPRNIRTVSSFPLCSLLLLLPISVVFRVSDSLLMTLTCYNFFFYNLVNQHSKFNIYTAMWACIMAVSVIKAIKILF